MTIRNERIGDVYTYCIDAADEITYISENWSSFAEKNCAADTCLPPEIYGSVIWDHIHDTETIHLYKTMVHKVRTHHCPIKVPICCDAPDLKRSIDISILPSQNDEVVFKSRIVGLESRPEVKLLVANHPRCDDLMIRICSFCKQIDLGQDHWVDTETAVTRMELFKYARLPLLTHTVCPACYIIATDKLK